MVGHILFYEDNQPYVKEHTRAYYSLEYTMVFFLVVYYRREYIHLYLSKESSVARVYKIIPFEDRHFLFAVYVK